MKTADNKILDTRVREYDGIKTQAAIATVGELSMRLLVRLSMRSVSPFAVIPADAGNQCRYKVQSSYKKNWIPACASTTA